MMVVEGQRVIRNTTPGIIHPQNHWFRCTMFIPRPDRVKVNRGKDVVIQCARLSGVIRLVIASIPIHMVIVDLFYSLFAYYFILCHVAKSAQVGLGKMQVSR
jgi:hypothetical protein